MLKKNMIYHEDHVPDNWRDYAVVLWMDSRAKDLDSMEDDAPVPDKESTVAAFHRISECRTGSHVKFIDEGDQMFYFYRGGWIRAETCEGGWVGILTAE